MTRTARRSALAVAMVLAALLAARCSRTAPPPQPLPSSGRIVFVDTAGWYRRTPDEVAVLTPFDLTIDGLPAGLPMTLGPWLGAERPPDPAVDVYFRQPDVTLERTYYRADGEIVWLTAFGSRGAKSFHLFEHTPETCYPLGGWTITEFGPAGIPLGPLPLPINRGTAVGRDGSLVFLYFYVWDSPDRDSQRGVLTMRVAAPVTDNTDATMAMLARDFLPRLFASTIAWSRF